MAAEKTTCPGCGGTKQLFTGNYGPDDEPIYEECNLCDANGMTDGSLIASSDDDTDEWERKDDAT